MPGNRPSDRSAIRASSAWNGFADDVRARLVRSEFEGGIRLGALDEGDRVQVRTQNSVYELEKRDGQLWISGHPEFCPMPLPVRVRGSSWGGSMLKVAYLGNGMRMEFQRPDLAVVTTSAIQSIRVA